MQETSTSAGNVELKVKGLNILVYRDGQHIGRVWWNDEFRAYIAEDATGKQIGEHESRCAAIDQVDGWVTDEVAQDVADRIAAHFLGDPDYAPKVMDAGWDEGAGRVIVWSDELPDWAFLVRHGGMSDYGCAIEFEPMPLPEGVWVEVVNEQAIRVLPVR